MSNPAESRKSAAKPSPAASSPIPFAAETVQSPVPSSPSSGTGAAASVEVKPGTKIGKYQVIKLLGRGGMGAVFEALDVVLHRKVALKILPRELSENDKALQRFIREARLAARLNHPNAVGVYDVGRKGTVYFIAMELVKGKSGQELLESAAIDWREATRWTADSCSALSAAHAAGLIHRDIKPANILRAGDSGAIKLSDFGLAKPTDSVKHLSLTQKDTYIGTPLFMSPEQCRNDAVDARSDIYSLGATYFTLLTGRPPYFNGTAMQILFAHCSAPIPDVNEHNPEAPALCNAIVQRAMAKDPKDRYQSADEMLADLEKLVRGEASDFDPMLSAMKELAPSHSQMSAAAPAPMSVSGSVWQSTGMSARERQWWMRGILAGVLLLVLGGAIALIIGLTGGSEKEVTRATPRMSAPDISVPPAPAITPAPEPSIALAAPMTSSPPVIQQPEAPVPLAPADPPVSSRAPDAIKPALVETAAPAVAGGEDARPAPPVGAQPMQPPPQPTAPPHLEEAQTPPSPEEEKIDLPDTVANRPLRAYMAAKFWTKRAHDSGNKSGALKGAQALMLWHDFFARSPHAEHVPYVEESKRLAELLSPGISSRARVNPGAAGPPLPPQISSEPDSQQPPRQGEKPPQRPPKPARR